MASTSSFTDFRGLRTKPRPYNCVDCGEGPKKIRTNHTWHTHSRCKECDYVTEHYYSGSEPTWGLCPEALPNIEYTFRSTT